jgi:hypothetical protein
LHFPEVVATQYARGKDLHLERPIYFVANGKTCSGFGVRFALGLEGPRSAFRWQRLADDAARTFHGFKEVVDGLVFTQGYI